MTKIRAKSSFESFNYLVDCLRNNKKVYFSRFGDGEIFVMMGRNTRNHVSNPEAVKELNECIRIDDPLFLNALSVNLPVEKGMTKGVFKPYGQNDEFVEFLTSNDLVTNDGVFESQIMFHYISVFYPKKMNQFLEEFVRPKKKMFVGCTPKNVAEKLYGPIDYYVEIPVQFAYKNMDEWWPKVLENIDDVELLIPSAGMSSNIMNKRLWSLNKTVHSLDIGSIIDAVENKVSRTWIRLMGHRMNRVLPPEHRNRTLKFKVTSLLKDIKYFFRRMIK